MRLVVLILSVMFMAAIKCSRLENFDIDAVLKNERVLTNYVKCILDQGPCTREGRDIKKLLPEVKYFTVENIWNFNGQKIFEIFETLTVRKNLRFKEIEPGEMSKFFFQKWTLSYK